MKKRIFSLFIALAMTFSVSAYSDSGSTDIVCAECKKVIAEDSKFCSFCGALVDTSTEEECTTDTLDIENDIKFIKKIFSCKEIETLAMTYPKDITSYEDLILLKVTARQRNHIKVVCLVLTNCVHLFFALINLFRISCYENYLTTK